MRAYVLSGRYRSVPGHTGRARLVVVLALAAAMVASTTGCSRPQPKRVTGPAHAVASAEPTAPGMATAPQRTPDKVMLGSYLGLAGKKGPESYALRRQQLGRDPRIVHLYYDWGPLPDTFSTPSQNGVVLLSWGGTDYKTINSGSADAMLGRSADAIVRYGKPIFIRWAWEMNGDWFPWGGPKNGNNPDGYIAAWRHIHDLFVAHGASNVAWVWSPNAGSVPDEPRNQINRYYPGDAFVDWVGISGYLGASEDPETLFGFINKTYGPRKPIMIGETGALEKGGSVKADWINELAAWIKEHPPIAALVWFDTDDDHGDGKNWRIDSSAASLAAYKKLADDPYFQG
jgi:hypothetical protein